MPGSPGAPGAPGAPAATTGSIHGVVRDKAAKAVAGATITTEPQSVSATTDADGAFTLADIPIGAYTISATKSGYASFMLSGVGVVARGTTNVSLVLEAQLTAGPGTIWGLVTDSKGKPNATPPVAATPLAGVSVTVQGRESTLHATTDAQGAFTLTGVPPGPVFLSAAAPSTSFLEGETREAVIVPANGTVKGVQIILSARPSDRASYVGTTADSGTARQCNACHPEHMTALSGAAHYRSLTRIRRDASRKAMAAAFARVLNPLLATPRTVMVPLAGTISLTFGATTVTGAGTTFASGSAPLQVGDKLGYTPPGLGWTVIGTIATIIDDSHLTLAAPAALAQGVPSVSAVPYSVARLSPKSHRRMWPEDSTDIVAPAWPGVKATNPNYDPNDCRIYNSDCAGGPKYPDGQVFVYLCNLKDGINVLEDEYVQKFGGSPYSCSDGSFFDPATNSNPAVPMVHIDVIYGGQGDKDGKGEGHANMGVFKQRFQGRLADVKAASLWTPAYTSTADRDRDSLTLPIQILESGDRVNGGFKMNGYHPTEQKFPGESWSQRTRTFSHACAGCHNTGMELSWDMVTMDLQIPRDDGAKKMTYAAVKSYKFIDENLTCEHCHGPGSEHATLGGKGNAIINPAYLTAEAERQLCGKCHAYDDGQNKSPEQTYGFEYPWNDQYAAKLGRGDFVPGAYQLSEFIGNWSERVEDEEAFWNPAQTGGKLYGQAHRQQYLMFSFSTHANNPYQKLTCSSCHSSHSTFLGTTVGRGASGDQYAFQSADFRNNVMCLGCHSGYGPFAKLSKDDVAALQMASRGVVQKNGVAMKQPDEAGTEAALAAIARVVNDHMADKAKMSNSVYDPSNDANPVGRCSSCHMPKVAKSGGYTTGPDALGNESLVEGDQASHVFDIIWPYQSTPRSVGGPTPSSAAYGTKVVVNVDGTVTTYNKYGYMPNSCGKCHAGSRRASDIVMQ